MEADTKHRPAATEQAPSAQKKSGKDAGSGNATAPKKGPGRPKKENIAAAFDICGVVEKATNPEFLLEAVSCSASMFKQIFGLFKSYDAEVICAKFRPAGIEFTALDHLLVSNIFISVNVYQFNYYFCREEFTIFIAREHLENIFAGLDKGSYKVTLVVNSDVRAKLFIVVKDLEYASLATYEVVGIDRPRVPPDIDLTRDANFPVKFTVPSKYLRQRINQMKKFAKGTWRIHKRDGKPLQFTFDDGRVKTITYNEMFENDATIRLQTTLLPAEIFVATIPIGHISPFSSLNLGEEVHICLDSAKGATLATVVKQYDKDLFTVNIFLSTSTRKDEIQG